MRTTNTIILLFALLASLAACTAKPMPGSLADYQARLNQCNEHKEAALELLIRYRNTVTELQAQCR